MNLNWKLNPYTMKMQENVLQLQRCVEKRGYWTAKIPIVGSPKTDDRAKQDLAMESELLIGLLRKKDPFDSLHPDLKKRSIMILKTLFEKQKHVGNYMLQSNQKPSHQNSSWLRGPLSTKATDYVNLVVQRTDSWFRNIEKISTYNTKT